MRTPLGGDEEEHRDFECFNMTLIDGGVWDGDVELPVNPSLNLKLKTWNLGDA